MVVHADAATSSSLKLFVFSPLLLKYLLPITEKHWSTLDKEV